MNSPQFSSDKTVRFTLLVSLLVLISIILAGASLKMIGEQSRTKEERYLNELEAKHDERVLMIENFSHTILEQLIEITSMVHAENAAVQPFWPGVRLPTSSGTLPGLEALLVFEGTKRCYPLISLSQPQGSSPPYPFIRHQQRLLQLNKNDLFLRNRNQFFKELTSPVFTPGLDAAAQYLAFEKSFLNEKKLDSHFQRISIQDSLIREQIGHALLIKQYEWEIVHAMEMEKKDENRHFYLADQFLIVTAKKGSLQTIALFDKEHLLNALLDKLDQRKGEAFALRVGEEWFGTEAPPAGEWVLKETLFKKNHHPVQLLRSYRLTPHAFRLETQRSEFFQKLLVGVVLLIVFFSLINSLHSFHKEKRLLAIKVNFLNSVSHELKTPLTSIKLIADTLATGRIVSTDRVVSYAHAVRKESQRLEQLVEDILNYNRLEQGVPKELFQSVDLYERTAEIIARMEPIAQAKGLSLTFSGQRGAVIMGEVRSLDSLIGNLIDNAIKYTPAEGKISVIVEQRGTKAVLVVSDNGMGIAADEQGKIFDLFYRIGDEMVRNTPGSGLGLAIVERSAKLHNAHISIHSTPQKGTIFTVTFGADHV